MGKLIHTILCNVSRRYRVTHCQHVDELPMRIQRRIRKSCEEMDPRSWDSVDDFMRDLIREIDEEESAKSGSFDMKKAAAVFA